MEWEMNDSWSIPHHPESPCIECPRDRKTGGCSKGGSCAIWHKWFRGKWEDIQKSAGIERVEETE